jgi:hypothetical protein
MLKRERPPVLRIPDRVRFWTIILFLPRQKNSPLEREGERDQAIIHRPKVSAVGPWSLPGFKRQFPTSARS